MCVYRCVRLYKFHLHRSSQEYIYFYLIQLLPLNIRKNNGISLGFCLFIFMLLCKCFACMSVHYGCNVQGEQKRNFGSSGTEVNRWLVVTMSGLGTKPESSAKGTNVLNCYH